MQYPPAAFSVKITHFSHQCKSAVFKGALGEIRATYYIQLQSCVITTGIRGVPISHCPGSQRKILLNFKCKLSMCACVFGCNGKKLSSSAAEDFSSVCLNVFLCNLVHSSESV